MLVLTRGKNESIRIADQITIKVLRISGSKVKIGIDAPAEIKVMRSEIAAAVQAEIRNERLTA